MNMYMLIGILVIIILLSIALFIERLEPIVNSLPEKKIFTEEELNKFLEPNTTNNYLWKKEEINGKMYYIRLN